MTIESPKKNYNFSDNFLQSIFYGSLVWAPIAGGIITENSITNMFTVSSIIFAPLIAIVGVCYLTLFVTNSGYSYAVSEAIEKWEKSSFATKAISISAATIVAAATIILTWPLFAGTIWFMLPISLGISVGFIAGTHTFKISDSYKDQIGCVPLLSPVDLNNVYDPSKVEKISTKINTVINDNVKITNSNNSK